MACIAPDLASECARPACGYHLVDLVFHCRLVYHRLFRNLMVFLETQGDDYFLRAGMRCSCSATPEGCSKEDTGQGTPDHSDCRPSEGT